MGGGDPYSCKDNINGDVINVEDSVIKSLIMGKCTGYVNMNGDKQCNFKYRRTIYIMEMTV